MIAINAIVHNSRGKKSWFDLLTASVGDLRFEFVAIYPNKSKLTIVNLSHH